MGIREYKGSARAVYLTGEIDGSALILPTTGLTGWPTGDSGPFFAVINRQKANEEKNPRDDVPMKELFAAFEGADCTSAAALGTEQQEDTAVSTCVVCCVHKAEVAHSECGHLCLCCNCDRTPPLPDAVNVLDACPMCRRSGPRMRIFA